MSKPVGPGGVGLVTDGILLAIRAYKLFISWMFSGSCRFTPSCSEYATEAVRRHGPWRGSLLSARRVARCQPLGGWGFDPVPGAGSEGEPQAAGRLRP